MSWTRQLILPVSWDACICCLPLPSVSNSYVDLVTFASLTDLSASDILDHGERMKLASFLLTSLQSQPMSNHKPQTTNRLWGPTESHRQIACLYTLILFPPSLFIAVNQSFVFIPHLLYSFLYSFRPWRPSALWLSLPSTSAILTHKLAEASSTAMIKCYPRYN